MTVINTNRTAHCPLCNKSINRRSITGDEKVGTLVEKARNLIGNIGKDTGFDSKYGLVSILFSDFVRKEVHGIMMPMPVHMFDPIRTFKMMSLYETWFQEHHCKI
jgi:hypothetical protein